MHQVINFPGMRIIVSLAVVFSFILLAVSAWFSPYYDGRQAVQEGRYEEGLVLLARAEQRFNNLQFARLIFPGIYEDSIASQFYILYQTGQYDSLLEKSASSPMLAPIHFWTGCVMFRRSGGVTDVQERIQWLERAADEFGRALELEPDNWDVKYNFELSKRLIAELQDKEEAPPQVLELLRPRPKQGEQSVRQSG